MATRTDSVLTARLREDDNELWAFEPLHTAFQARLKTMTRRQGHTVWLNGLVEELKTVDLWVSK